jgi:4-hydroxybenzoate polyprenyltransferase
MPTFQETIRQLYDKERKYISTFRVFNTRSMILFYLVGLKINGDFYWSTEILKITIIFILTYASASTINFIYDTEIDKQNKRYNPLFELHINKQRFWFITVCLWTTTLCISAITNNPLPSLGGAAVLLILGVIYSAPPFKLSHRPLLKLISMAITYSYIPILMGIGLSGTAHADIALLVASFYVACLPYSDVKDIEGDRAHNKITLAVLLGARRLSILCTVVSFGLYLTILVNRNSLFPLHIVSHLLFISIILAQVVALIVPKLLFKKKIQQGFGYITLFWLLSLIFF